jgi:hypothetical protein
MFGRRDGRGAQITIHFTTDAHDKRQQSLCIGKGGTEVACSRIENPAASSFFASFSSCTKDTIARIRRSERGKEICQHS